MFEDRKFLIDKKVFPLTVILYILLSFVPFFIGCSKSNPKGENENFGQTRVISFSGYEWEVRSSREEKSGPGPNYFSDSDENVWVDDQGRLHLRITHKNGKWYCAGVTLLRSPGYGRYFFQTSTRMDLLDINSVVGLFLYRNDSKEIDIEFSKWGNEQNKNAQYVIQPGGKEGNKKRFDLDFESKELTSIINWQEDSIVFYNYEGNTDDTASDENLIHKWEYYGGDNPSDKDDLATKINFWLFRGKPPSNQEELEIIISSFKKH